MNDKITFTIRTRTMSAACTIMVNVPPVVAVEKAYLCGVPGFETPRRIHATYVDVCTGNRTFVTGTLSAPSEVEFDSLIEGFVACGWTVEQESK